MQSYAGKYVPAISYYIHKNNPTAKVKINLKGMAIGDGLCDPEMVCIDHVPFCVTFPKNIIPFSFFIINIMNYLFQMLGGYGEFMYQTGLIDENQKQHVVQQTDYAMKLIRQQKWVEAFKVRDAGH